MKSILPFGLVAVVLMLSACSTIETKQLSDEKDKEVFKVIAFFNEPVKSLDSYQLHSASKDACPKGYDVLHRNASKAAELGLDHAQCVSPGGCEYALEWKIQCADKPEEGFSLFGKF